MKHYYPFILILATLGCQNGPINGSDLKKEEIQYITKLGLLDPNEKIILFDSQSDFETSGNFFTEQRIASYWISDKKEESDTNYAFFKDVDSLLLTDLVNDFSYASYITVYLEDGANFRVHIDADSADTYHFYDLAMKNWEKAKSEYEKLCTCQDEFGQFESYETKQAPHVIFDKRVALLFFDNYIILSSGDNFDITRLPKHLQNPDRQAIYENIDAIGMYGSFIQPTLDQYEIPKIDAHIADSCYGFMVNEEVFLIDTKVMLRMDGVIFYQPGKTPVYWTPNRTCKTCKLVEGLECYYDL